MYDNATITALQSGRLVLRDFLTVHGWNNVGTPTDFCFWTGEVPVTTNVVSALDGSTVSRNFIGGGALPPDGIPPIVDTMDLNSRAIDIKLSQLDSSVQSMLRSNDIRVAVVELHRGVFDPTTWALVSTPFPRFLGRVDTAPLLTPEVGGEGQISLTVIPDSIDLTRTNPALKSDENQKLKSSDAFRQYADAAGSYDTWWGQLKGAA